MDFLDDPFAEDVVFKAPTTGRFQPKAKPHPKKGPSTAARTAAVKATKESPVTDSVEKNLDASKSSSLTDNKSSRKPVEDGSLSVNTREIVVSAVIEHSEITGLSITEAETPTPDVSNIQPEEELSDFPNVSLAHASYLRPCNLQTASEGYKESIVCDNGDFQIDIEQLEAGDYSCLDKIDLTTELAAASEKRAVKFQPKPKEKIDKQKDTTKDGSIHVGESDTISDVLHMSLDADFTLDSSMYLPDNVVTEDTDSLMPEILPQRSGEDCGERNSYDAFGSSFKLGDEGFPSRFEGNENGYERLDVTNDVFQNNSRSYDRVPDESVTNRGENNDGEPLGEEISLKKRPRKSQKVAAENNKTESNKPGRKRKKATQKLNETVEKPPKRFPRATRRKRCVDKSLLEAPEDELDLQRVPIRDLIILAEYKERIAKKEAAAAAAAAAAAMPPPTTERTDNFSSEDPPYDDNETFGYDQDGDTFDHPSTSGVQKDTGYFNYQSFMTKEPRVRWTKQDTELFYKGLTQFGSDLSMVQQLFPGRTRHQIKLKYKKEERQNPMRLHDALTSRSQDLSHFELVIERLQEQAAQDAKNDDDDSVCVMGEDHGPEEVLNTHEDVTNTKQNEEDQVVNQEPENHQVESSPKSHYSEDEDFDWSEYKSEL